MEATATDLLAFAGERIGERAAIPKQIQIIQNMPITAVGKIFKPQLRWWATEDTYREALTVLQPLAEAVTLIVGPDDTHETVARITVRRNQGSAEEIRQNVDEILGKFSTRYVLEVVEG
jgi:fatty-acyl-CoA synthase